MSNFLNYENIIKLFQSFIDNIIIEKGRKNAIFSPETEIIQRLVNYTNKILEKLFEKYLVSCHMLHYWEIILLNFNKQISVKYINSLDFVVNDKERSFIWIFFELFYIKQMDKLLVNFRNNEEISKEDLYRLIYDLQKIMFIENFSIKSSLFENFKLFIDENSLDKLKTYEDLKNQWSIYYNRMVEYKKNMIIMENKKTSPKKHLGITMNSLDTNFSNSNDSTPITKSNCNFDITLTEMNEKGPAHNSDKVYQNLYKVLINSFTFEKTHEKITTVSIK